VLKLEQDFLLQLSEKQNEVEKLTASVESLKKQRCGVEQMQ
jgi:hypothetical protein